MSMLNDYEIQKKSNLLVIATLKLCVSLLVIYGAILFVPNVVENVRGTQLANAEQLKIRVIANSNSTQDQQKKLLVVENIQAYIEEHGDTFDDIHSFKWIYQDIQKNHPNLNVEMKIGDNLLPPKIQFHQFYPQSNHQSVLFVIGSGRGDNWFCAVFPTLCRLEEDGKNEKPPFYLYEWWKKKKQKTYAQ